MKRILIGFGDYKDYHLAEVPDDFLAILQKRFPLDLQACASSNADYLLVTIAVNQECARRGEGGKALRRMPSVRELALDIVNQGFRHVSKVHHPDRNGEVEAQKRASDAKRQLLDACNKLKVDYEPGAILIDSTTIRPPGRQFSEGITDDDVPF